MQDHNINPNNTKRRNSTSTIKEHHIDFLLNRKFKLYGLLCSRMVFFAFFQAVIALILNSWDASEKYWMLTATLGNFVSIYLLVMLFKQENKHYLDLFHFDKLNLGKDLALFLLLLVILIPLALAPNYFLSKYLWGDPMHSYAILFQTIPKGVSFFLLIAFPISIALAELATYYGYLMPKLKKTLKKQWLAVLLPVIFLSIQHCCLPLIFDAKFILYRGLMYLPFALLIGLAIHKRPRLLPYFVILHGLMDLQAIILLIVL